MLQMIKKSGAIIVVLLFSACIYAQEGVVTIRNGRVIDGGFFKTKEYVLPSFREGKVKLRDGSIYEGVININTLTQTISLINSNGDTLAVNNENMVDVVSLGSSFFFKIGKNYLQVIETNGEVSLGLLRALRIGEEKRTGAYGGSSETSTIVNVNSLTLEGVESQFTTSHKLKCKYEESLFLIYKGRPYVPGMKNFQKLFPKHKKEIGSYFKSVKAAPDDNERIIQVFKYAIGL